MSFGMRDLALQFSPQDPDPEPTGPDCHAQSDCEGKSHCLGDSRACGGTDPVREDRSDAALDLGALRLQLRAALSSPMGAA